MIVECPGCKNRYDVAGRPPGTRARCRCGRIFALPVITREAGRLDCPACGAGVAANAHRCEYCAAELRIKACPRCFARVFHHSRHCPSCGAKIDAPARALEDGTAARRQCPRCTVDLDARLVGDVLLDECGRCHGVWLDAAAFERVIDERREAAKRPVDARPTDSDFASAAGEQSVGASTQQMYIRCPDCEQLMNRTNFGRRSAIIIDVCRAHGTWFDASELPRVIHFVMRGGLEETERRAVEEAREAARRERAAGAALHLGLFEQPVGAAEAAGAFGGLLRAIARVLAG